MQSRSPLFRLLLKVCGRLSLGLLLLLGLCLVLGGQVRPAHAQSTLTVTDCSSDSQLQADVTQANNDNAHDTITFSCSGDIKLTSTLTITGSMTIDGSGQSVTLDGQKSIPVLIVYSSSLTLNTLTIANGSADSADNDSGGGIWNGGTLNISNSTLSNNSAPNGPGGSIWNGGTLNISNSTLSNNSAYNGGGIFNNNTLSISGSIVAENQNGDCTNQGTITDNGSNLESGTGCGFTGTGSKQNTNAQLSALANNGGPTQTMALQQGSPAIDAVPLSSNLCSSTDQRGDPRPDVDSSAETACDIGAYESSYPAVVDNDLGLTNMPANITTNATSSQGATVTYASPTATDEGGDSSTASVTCTPASGSTFAIGTTTVTCTATDSDDTNSPVSQSFTVTVNDTDLGLTNMPANLTVNATSPQGATVTYTSPTVVDEDSPLPPVSCTTASGSTFPIGTTTVTCTVTDRDDTNSPVSSSFQVVVNGAATQVSDLITTVNSFHLSNSLQTSLDNKLQDVLTAVNGGQTATACSELTDFIGHVQSQSGKGLTTAQATQLIAAAKQVQAVLGC